jgi:putative SOS response-associated peptidase YedK
MRRKDEGPIEHNVFAFFTTEPNDVMRPIHPKAMPVILITGEEQATWLTAPWSEARKLQRPLADGELEIVNRLPYKELPGVGTPTGGDLLRIPVTPREPTLL